MVRQKKSSDQQQPENLWRRVLTRKWLKIAADDSYYSADSDSDSDSENGPSWRILSSFWPLSHEFSLWFLVYCFEFLQITATGQTNHGSRMINLITFRLPQILNLKYGSGYIFFTLSPFLRAKLRVDFVVRLLLNPEPLPRLRRRNSETFRAQYINTKEIRVCASTWNVGGNTPPDDLDLDGWLDIDDPADIYVIGLQEIIPLNAGNIFGSEDSRPVSKWENVIRETLNRVPPPTKFKSFSNPPSPSRLKLPEDAPNIADEVVLETDSDFEEEIYPVNEESNDFHETEDGLVEGSNFVSTEPSASSNGDDFVKPVEHDLDSQSPKRLNRMNCLRINDSTENMEAWNAQCLNKLTKTLSGTERMGLSWPEPPLHLLPQPVFENHNSSFRTSKSFRTYNSFKSNMVPENRLRFDLAALSELDLESVIYRRRRPPYVKLVSKQMVGILIMIWARRSLRKHIQNLNVSTVGVGIMGYIGNKGSVSVSMSIHQTLFCFICTHLTAGEKDSDAIKRNADVHGIHKRTHFNHLSSIGLPRRIYDHERIIWLGDLNYRINLSYEQTRELISKKEWSKLLEQDQLVKEFKKGRAFDGWSEGTLSFAPTYKYELNSESYFGEDPKSGRRTPAWCDRILSFGPGIRVLSYERSEFMLSDHRPVTASYMVEVEVFSPRRLQRALTFTDAEVEEQDIVSDMGHTAEMDQSRLGEDTSY